jgi:putative membrane protein
MAAWLPHINAGLNFLAALLLCAGFYFIRRREIGRHRAMMLAAAAVSAVFLVSYLAHRANAPILKFYGPDSLEVAYYTLLISHVGLSIAIVPLVAITMWRALASRFDPHRRIARYTWPAWMYVSVSGIFVYLILYQIYPAPA